MTGLEVTRVRGDLTRSADAAGSAESEWRSRLPPQTMYRHCRACATSEYHRIHGPRIAKGAVNHRQGALWLPVIKERQSSDPRTDARPTVRRFSPPGGL